MRRSNACHVRGGNTGVMTAFPRIVVPRITGTSLLLRPFEETDVDALFDASADPAITAVTTVPDVVDPGLAAEWIARQHERASTGLGYSFAIQSDQECVGQIGLWLHDVHHGRATIGYWIRPSRRRRGHAFSALQTLSEWAWSIPELHRLQLHVEPANEASCRTAERAGFEREGLLRSWQAIGDERRDMVVYGLIRPQ